MKHIRPTCVRNQLAGKRRRTTNKCEVEAGCGKEGVSGNNVENDGRRTIGGKISLVKDQRQRSIDSWLMKKSRQEYKVSGSRNRQPENAWSK